MVVENQSIADKVTKSTANESARSTSVIPGKNGMVAWYRFPLKSPLIMIPIRINLSRAAPKFRVVRRATFSSRRKKITIPAQKELNRMARGNQAWLLLIPGLPVISQGSRPSRMAPRADNSIDHSRMMVGRSWSAREFLDTMALPG